MSLFRRVFLLNAALLVATGGLVALWPITVGTPVQVFDEVVLGVGLVHP